MKRSVVAVIALAACVSLAAATFAASAPVKKKSARNGAYGFLPGYRPPARAEREWAREHPAAFWFGYPRYYNGRWNGGGFGPCWTQTPIGPIWNCGM
jgi:hypothetical protein